jgi:hypothetical protein
MKIRAGASCRLGKNALEKRAIRNRIRVFFLALFHSRSEGAVVNIVTRLLAEELRDCNSICGRGKVKCTFVQALYVQAILPIGGVEV